jgi:alanine racemase
VHRIQATISLAALRHNFSVARIHAPESRVIAMVKANAYGHGLIPVAEALHDADLFGVTDIDEAEILTSAGLNKPVLILQGLIEKPDIRRVVNGAFQLIIHRPEDLLWLEAALDAQTLKVPLTLWLKLDSGMGRLGLTPAELPVLYNALKLKNWAGEIRLMTHLANAGMPDNPLNTQQLDCYSRVLQQGSYAGCQTSIAASAGILALHPGGDWIRPGLMLYGSSPFAWQDEPHRRDHYGLRAVMKLEARMISIRDHQAGDSIGYNSWFICPKAMRIGIVSAGYADGYPAMTPNGCPVMINGVRTRTLGRVSMDMLAIDLSDVPGAAIDMPVELWGDSISIDEVAGHTGIISYQLMSGLTARVPKIHV